MTAKKKPARKVTPPPAAAVEFRAPKKAVARFLAKRGLTVDQIAAGDPLTAAEVDFLIARADPVAFAWTYLVEPRAFEVDGVTWCRQFDGWKLAKKQRQMQRLIVKHDTIFECGTKVGKTRAVVAATLHAVHTRPGGVLVLIVGNMKETTKAIFSAIEEQIRLVRQHRGVLIGGGLEGRPTRGTPSYEFRFRNGSVVNLRIVGDDGESLRGAHVDLVLADEVAKYRAPEIFAEMFARTATGGRICLLSSPDGNYSSPFWGLCNRAKAVDGREAEEKKDTEAIEDERGFWKFNIARPDLPPPFWTEKAAATLRAKLNGENSVAWQTTVLGRWGTPSYSIFPMSTLKPCLRRDLEHYRVVVAQVNREEERVRLRVARLGREEEMLADDSFSLGGVELPAAIARWFPDTRDWKEPFLGSGWDLGSATDPTEGLWVRREGNVWTDVFRLHLENAGWPLQKEILAHLDHASGHRVRYAIDRGSAGASIVEDLRELPEFRTCPVAGCRADVFFDERVVGVAFGEMVSEVNPDTGEPVLDETRRNAAGLATPFRLSNKEFSTRILERKVQAGELRIADDGGASDKALASALLLTNHTSTGITAKGERRFKGVDDHAVDARRLSALAIAHSVAKLGGVWLPADPALVASIARDGHVRTPDFPDWGGRAPDGSRMQPASPEERRGESEGFRGFGGGSIRGGNFGPGW